MEIQARFTHDKLDHTKDNTPYLVVSVKAPTLDWVQKRPALCLLPVIDLSGSMKGDKLEYAKKSLHKLVDHIQDGDVTGLVAFESRVHVLVEPAEVTPELKTKMHQAIDRLRVMGGTNFADGMLRAVEAIHTLDLSNKYLKRIVMFTDGQPTEGVTNTTQILSMLEQRRGSVTVSAFGYGDVRGGTWNGCDQKFLESFSEKGAGNYAYVQDPDDALAAFGKELGGLLSTYATNLRLELTPVKGHEVTRVISNVEKTEEEVTGEIEIRSASILSEEVQHFVFQTKLKEQSKSFPRETTVFTVKLTYDVLTEDGRRETQTAEANARVQFLRAADAVATPNKEVDEIAALHRMIRAQLEAEEMAKKGQYEQATNYMADLSHQVRLDGHANVAVAASAIGTRLASASAYNGSQGFLRSLSRGVTRGYSGSSYDVDAENVLENLNVSVSNEAMGYTSSSFTSDLSVGTAGLVAIGGPEVGPDLGLGTSTVTVSSTSPLLAPSASLLAVKASKPNMKASKKK